MHELLALEAVDRLSSVQAAAEALHVTPSGVSHRIASLERRLGAKMLQRRGRGVVLTALALDCVQAIRPSLSGLAQSSESLRHDEHRVVRIASAPAAGITWLLPCIKQFSTERREARFHITTVGTPDELPPDGWDVLIHYGAAARRGKRRQILHTERLICVAAPDVRERAAPKALRLVPLFGARGRATASRREVDGPAQLVFDDALTMLEAAAAGAGTAWCTETSAAPFLAADRLVRVSDDSIEGDRYFVDLSEAGRFKPMASEFFDRLGRLARA